MMLSAFTPSIATFAFERLLFCLTAGMALVAVIAVLIKLLPAGNSHTRFVVWFSALVAVAALPFSVFIPARWLTARSLPAHHALLTIPVAWAEYMVLGWALIAAIGLTRLLLGLFQLRRLRRSSLELKQEILDQETRALIDSFCRRRPITLLVSSDVEVPTAIGFVRPAIVLPAWLMGENKLAAGSNASNDDLKYILLHELAHLRRWDDWTNLAQQFVQSVLFFHPGILWIKHKLALDREMACDDAVLAETGSPHNYAQCLAHVAERSFLRRQMALAQAAVSRVKQLSCRVGWILNREGSHSTHVWKPAIPLVAGAAFLCAISASSTNELIGFSNPLAVKASTLPAAISSQNTFRKINAEAITPGAARVTQAGFNTPARVQALPANLKYSRPAHPPLPARKAQINDMSRRNLVQRAALAAEPKQNDAATAHADSVLSSYSLVPFAEQSQNSEVVLVIVRGRQSSMSDHATGWQITSWQLYLYVSARAKPIPHKT